MKLVFKTFLIYIVVQAIITTMIINCSNRGIVYVADFMIQIFQLILILKIYKKTSTKTIIHTSLKENMNMLLLSFIIIISFSVFESGLIAFFIPNYVQNHPMYLVAIINAIIFAPIIEEIIFRGILMNMLERTFKSPYFIIGLNAVVFAMMHVIYLNSIFVLPMTFIAGIGFAWMYYQYKNLPLISIAHTILNFTAMILGFFMIR